MARHAVWAAAFMALVVGASVGASSVPQSDAPLSAATDEGCGCKAGIRAQRLRLVKETAAQTESD